MFGMSIRSIVTPAKMAVFLSSILLFGGFLLFSRAKGEEIGVLGGPIEAENEDTEESYEPQVLLYAFPRLTPEETKRWYFDGQAEPVGHDASLIAPATIFAAGASRAAAPITPAGIIKYIVKKGDTLSRIAAEFNISIAAIVDANPEVREKALQIGQELTLLPVPAVAYVVENGETIEEIASSFGVSIAEIQAMNQHVEFGKLYPGMTIFIPGTRKTRLSLQSGNSLPSISGYFANPAEGFNWGKLHAQNAVDIANSCGTPVYASADGLVIDSADQGFNSGYGRFVLMEHPNGTRTRYAHLSEIMVSIGDYVQQGKVIALMGATGNVHGPTGCHLHFEVIGAQNPFAK